MTVPACLQAALEYLARGWSVLAICPPDHAKVGTHHEKHCKNPGKAPWGKWKEFQERLPTEDELRRKFRDNPHLNVGIALGPVSGLIRVDVDGPGGEAKLERLSGGDLPATLEFTSGRANGGRGLLFRIPEGVTLRTTSGSPKKGEELRFQAKGAQTVLPPSRHASGSCYAWRPGHAPDEIEAAIAPSWLVQALSEVRQPPRAGGMDGIGDRKRILNRAEKYIAKMPAAVSGNGGHDQTFAVACTLVHGFGLSVEEALPIITRYNERCQPPWAEAELLHKLHDAEKQPGERGHLLNGLAPHGSNGPDQATVRNNGDASEANTFDQIHLTDLGNARRVVKRHGAGLRYCKSWKSWLTWDGRRWAEDATGEAVRCVKETQGALFAEIAQNLNELRQAQAEGDDEDGERASQIKKLNALLKHALEWEKAKSIYDSLLLATTEPSIPVVTEQLDVNPYLLNCLNGTVDLRTGEVRPHRREDLLTKLCPVEYRSDAVCPRWEGFLHRIMNGNQDLIEYLQRVVGYSLTAVATEQCLWFFYGTGANGKSTFLTTIRDLMGDYAIQAVSELLLAKKSESHPTERADLFGRRFVATIEVDKGRQIAEALMKQLTGGENIRARKLYKDFFEFPPTWKIFLAANHKPVLRGTDHAVWRRIKLVPFEVTIPDEEKDKDLPQKLKAESHGILAWAVRGCMKWLQHGLQEPEEVKAATDKYRAEQDTLATFIDACCVCRPEVRVSASELLEKYERWSGDKLSPKAFTAMMEEKGYPSRRGTGGYAFYHGIGLPAPEE